MPKRRKETGPKLTLDVIERINARRIKQGMSPKALAARAKMSVRRFQEWVSERSCEKARAGDPIRARIELFKSVADALDCQINDLLNQPLHEPRQGHSDAKADFVKLAQIAKRVDQDLIAITRHLITSPANIIHAAYRHVLSDSLHEYGYDLAGWIRGLENAAMNGRLVATAPPAGLKIEVGANFEDLMFHTTGSDKLRVRNPKLLWDCACQTPDNKSQAKECPIHGQPMGTAIEAAFKQDMIEIDWRGISTRWCREPDLWPPSVDSFWFMMELAQAGLFSENCESILDLGSGTGFLGIAFATHNHTVRRVALSDWLLTPSLYGALNWSINCRKRQDMALAIKIGMFSDWMREDAVAVPHDVVLCNPPYLPLLPGFEKFGVHAVVAGTELLTHVVEHAPKLGRRVFLQYSHLARTEAQDKAKSQGFQLVPLGQKPRHVPFRVRLTWTEMPTYFNALKSMRGGLIAKSYDRHPFWHKIQAYEVKPFLP